MKVDLFGSLDALERGLDFHLDRQGVLASNLANAETPGFRPKDLVPAGEAGGALPLEGSSGAHLQGDDSQGATVVVEGETNRPDNNAVHLERTMAEMSANRLRYDTMAELARRRLALLRYAASDGGL